MCLACNLRDDAKPPNIGNLSSDWVALCTFLCSAWFWRMTFVNIPFWFFDQDKKRRVLSCWLWWTSRSITSSSSSFSSSSFLFFYPTLTGWSRFSLFLILSIYPCCFFDFLLFIASFFFIVLSLIRRFLFYYFLWIFKRIRRDGLFWSSKSLLDFWLASAHLCCLLWRVD
jgi:hypothetical protein